MSNSRRRAVLTESPLVIWTALDMGTSWRFSLFNGPSIWRQTSVRCVLKCHTNWFHHPWIHLLGCLHLLERHVQVRRRQCRNIKRRLWQRRQGVCKRGHRCNMGRFSVVFLCLCPWRRSTSSIRKQGGRLRAPRRWNCSKIRNGRLCIRNWRWGSRCRDRSFGLVDQLAALLVSDA